MAQEKFKNNGLTTLAQSLNSTATTVVVNDGSVFPSSGNFRVTIDDEIMLVTAISSNTLTVTRAQEGTTAASHWGGYPVLGECALGVSPSPRPPAAVLLLTKGSLDQWLLDARARDTYANIPTAGDAGRLFIPSDGCSFAIDTGSIWQHFSTQGGFQPNLTPPIDADFSWVNQGSSTVSTAMGGVYLSTPAASGWHMRCRYKAKTAPYKITMHFMSFIHYVDIPAIGMGFRDSSGGKLLSILKYQNAGGSGTEVKTHNDADTSGTSKASVSSQFSGHMINWLQIEDNNTNLIFRYSCNGKMWIDLYSESRTTFIASGPTGAFFFVNANNASLGCAMHVIHWLEE